MPVDKNLFMYDLAIVAIMKNEGPYVKEWLDYYLAAGVDHFFIYDNESPDNMKEVLQPYIEKEIVTYIFFPGKAMQQVAYNEAIQKFRFFCRYIAFVDTDEFIFPQSDKSILEVTDEIFENKPTAGGLVIQWMTYGSNNLDKADYSKGVLERFTRHASELKSSIKTITDPRKVNYMFTPHYMVYFDGFHQLDEVSLHFFPNTDYKISDKIIMNHYQYKSKEEYALKNPRGDVAYGTNTFYPMDNFSHEKDNDVFDDSILKYRDKRKEIFGDNIKKVDHHKLYSALLRNLSPTLGKNPSKEVFAGKMETFLTCRKLAEYLRDKILEDNAGKFFEEAALNAAYRSLFSNVKTADIKLLLSEMPNILPLDYPVVKNIVAALIKLISQIKDSIRGSITDQHKMHLWRDFTEYDYLMRLLKVFPFDEKK